jgi:hypothetical protein
MGQSSRGASRAALAGEAVRLAEGKAGWGPKWAPLIAGSSVAAQVLNFFTEPAEFENHYFPIFFY